MSIAKKIGNLFKKKNFSKIIATVILLVWILATSAQYVFNGYGLNVEVMGLTYSEINDTFHILMAYYFGSKTVENVTKIRSSIPEILEDVADDMNTKNK